ncbi:MAG TPA: class I lanthipeptide [Thermoanaerobaculia bacterium]|nr:class I lanthipeptide [Thermoanaerobaculia bacterium]
MKKQITKKLTLSKETLRNLSERELEGVVGGATRTLCSGGTSSCCTDTCFRTCDC